MHDGDYPNTHKTRSNTLHRALFYMMDHILAYKAMTSTEEQVGVIWRESRQSIKGITVDGN
jgi:hypothetical protein